MSNVINKNNLKYLKSVHTSNYNNADWIINPILPKCDKKYWKIKDNKVIEMSIIEKNSIDDILSEKAQVLEKANTREKLIQERMHKIAEDQLIEEGIIK